MRAVSFLLLIILISCRKETTVPADIIQMGPMTTLLIDVYLLESKIANLSLPSDSAALVYDHFHGLLLQKHEIDSLAFRRSMKFYNDNPDIYFKIHTTVVDSLSLREKTLKID